MINISESKRSVLKIIVSSICAASMLSACGTNSRKRRYAIENLVSLLRYQGVAAQLGRLEIEANPELESMTVEQIAADILDTLSIDINTINDAQIDSIKQQLPLKIREDFTNEAVTTIDGWLLSKTEAKVCVLVYLKVSQSDV